MMAGYPPAARLSDPERQLPGFLTLRALGAAVQRLLPWPESPRVRKQSFSRPRVGHLRQPLSAERENGRESERESGGIGGSGASDEAVEFRARERAHEGRIRRQESRWDYREGQVHTIDRGRITKVAEVGGLHHHYERVAA
jgi:hypothetical protein